MRGRFGRASGGFCSEARRARTVERQQTTYGFTNLLNVKGGLLAW